MTPDEMDAIVMAFPGAEKGISYGRPSYKLNGKFFTRLRREDDSVVLLDVSFDEREMLIEPSRRPSTSPRTTRTIPASWPASRRCTPARSRTSSNAASARSPRRRW